MESTIPAALILQVAGAVDREFSAT